MGKRGSWFAAILEVIASHFKDKPNKESEGEDKNKKKGHGKTRPGERKSFIPLSTQLSTIEKILGDAEREHNTIFRFPASSPPLEQPKTPSFSCPPPPAPPYDPSSGLASPKEASAREFSPGFVSPRTTNGVVSPRAPSLQVVKHRREISHRPELTLSHCHASATKIQAAYRGYMTRSSRASRGLVRLQGVVKGQNVKQQTLNAMKHMQLLVRVQSQIRLRRIQTLENLEMQQAQHKEVESSLGRGSLASEAGNPEDWDNSLLTKVEVETRLPRKVDAVIKRERAMADAYSHQSQKSTTRSAQTPSMNVHPGGYPWWWDWLERQLPKSNAPETQEQTPNGHRFTSPKSNSELKPSPRSTPISANKQPSHGFNNMDSATTPTSTRSSIPVSSSKFLQTPCSNRTVPPSVGSSGKKKYSSIKACGLESPYGMKDNDSLASCPPFSVPNYMAPTVSAKAKVRSKSNPKDRIPVTPTGESNGRSPFPLTQGIRSFKWSKGSFFLGSKDSSLQRGKDSAKHWTMDSAKSLSVNSAAFLPAGGIRKPFNRFV